MPAYKVLHAPQRASSHEALGLNRGRLGSSGKNPTETNITSHKRFIQRDECGRTLLHWLASLGESGLALACVRQTLRQLGCSPNFIRERDWESGWSAAHRAVYMGNLRVLVELMTRDQEVLLSRDHESLSPLDLYYLRFVDPLHDPTPKTNTVQEIWAWGENADFQLGIPLSTRASDYKLRRLSIRSDRSLISEHHESPFYAFSLEEGVVQIATAEQHTIFRTRDGRVFVAGFGANGRLGLSNRDSTTTHLSSESFTDASRLPFSRLQPVLLSPPEWEHTTVVHVAAGGKQSAAITKCGMLFVWGADVWTPTLAADLRRELMLFVDMSETHAIALSRDKTVYWASAEYPCKYRAVVHGPLGECNTLSVAAGGDYRCAAIVRSDHHDEVYVWQAGTADLRRVHFNLFTEAIRENQGAEISTPSERSTNPARSRGRWLSRTRRFVEVSAAGSFLAIRSEVGDLFLVQDRKTIARHQERDCEPVSETNENMLSKNLYVSLLRTSGNRSSWFKHVCCTTSTCYAVDDMGCLWQWNLQNLKQMHCRGRRLPHLRNVVDIAASNRHAFAIVACRNPTVCLPDAGLSRLQVGRESTEKSSHGKLYPSSLSNLCEQLIVQHVSLDTALPLLEMAANAWAPFLQKVCSDFLLCNLDILLASHEERGLALEAFPMALMVLERNMKEFLTKRQHHFVVQGSKPNPRLRFHEPCSREEAAAEQVLAEWCARYGIMEFSSTRTKTNEEPSKSVGTEIPTDSKKSRVSLSSSQASSGKNPILPFGRVPPKLVEKTRAEGVSHHPTVASVASRGAPLAQSAPLPGCHIAKPRANASNCTGSENHEDALNSLYTTVMLLPGTNTTHKSMGTSSSSGSRRITGSRPTKTVDSVQVLSPDGFHYRDFSRTALNVSGQTWLRSSPLTVEGSPSRQIAPNASSQGDHASQSFRELLRQEMEGFQKLSGGREEHVSQSSRARERALQTRFHDGPYRHSNDSLHSKQQKQFPSSSSLLVSNALPAALQSSKSSQTRSWGQDSGREPTEHPSCSFRELLCRIEQEDSVSSRYSRINPSPVWDRRFTSTQPNLSLAEIEYEERQKTAEMEEAAWLAQQIALIEAMEAEKSPSCSRERTRGRACHRNRRLIQRRTELHRNQT